MTDKMWRPPYEYSTGGGWGMHVTWIDTQKGRVYGHHPRIPRVGDLLRTPMQSGRVGIFRFTEVDRQMEPDDMFFGQVEAVGYEDELDMPALFNEPQCDGICVTGAEIGVPEYVGTVYPHPGCPKHDPDV